MVGLLLGSSDTGAWAYIQGWGIGAALYLARTRHPRQYKRFLTITNQQRHEESFRAINTYIWVWSKARSIDFCLPWSLGEDINHDRVLRQGGSFEIIKESAEAEILASVAGEHDSVLSGTSNV